MPAGVSVPGYGIQKLTIMALQKQRNITYFEVSIVKQASLCNFCAKNFFQLRCIRNSTIQLREDS